MMTEKTRRPGKRRGVVCPADLLRGEPAPSRGAGSVAYAARAPAQPMGAHKQFHGLVWPKQEMFIEDIIPYGI